MATRSVLRAGTWLVCGLWLGACASPPDSGPGTSLLGPGQAQRSLPFEVRDGKPMLRASVAGRQGVLMLDNGTPDAVFLNRDALALGPGQPVGRGTAASGQAIDVQAHAAPPLRVGPQPLALPATVRSGNFGFTAPGLGNDFLGFIGTPMVVQQAFVLDYGRRRLTLLGTDARGTLPLPGPGPADVLVELPFGLQPGGQPELPAQLLGQALRVDIDTGDGGTLYASAGFQAQLQAAGALLRDGAARGDTWTLRGLVLGGQPQADLPVQLRRAGSAQDLRPPQPGPPDLLRLGAAFLARQPSLWNFPGRRITLLRPDAAFLAQLPPAEPTWATTAP